MELNASKVNSEIPKTFNRALSSSLYPTPPGKREKCEKFMHNKRVNVPIRPLDRGIPAKKVLTEISNFTGVCVRFYHGSEPKRHN